MSLLRFSTFSGWYFGSNAAVTIIVHAEQTQIRVMQGSIFTAISGQKGD